MRDDGGCGSCATTSGRCWPRAATTGRWSLGAAALAARGGDGVAERARDLAERRRREPAIRRRGGEPAARRPLGWSPQLCGQAPTARRGGGLAPAAVVAAGFLHASSSSLIAGADGGGGARTLGWGTRWQRLDELAPTAALEADGGWCGQWSCGARERRGLLTWGRESIWGPPFGKALLPGQSWPTSAASLLELFFSLEWPKFNLERLIEKLLEML